MNRKISIVISIIITLIDCKQTLVAFDYITQSKSVGGNVTMSFLVSAQNISSLLLLQCVLLSSHPIRHLIKAKMSSVQTASSLQLLSDLIVQGFCFGKRHWTIKHITMVVGSLKSKAVWLRPPVKGPHEPFYWWLVCYVANTASDSSTLA